MSNKLRVKDLITIGIFFVLYYIVSVIIASLGGIIVSNPIGLMCWPTIAGILSGTVVILFMVKVPKPFAFFIFGMLHSIISSILGYHFITVVFSLVFLTIAELILRKGEYKSFKSMAIAYGLLSASLSGFLMQMFVAKEHYIAMMSATGNDRTEFIATLERIVTPGTMVIVIIGGFIGGIIGAYIGKAMLKKHFERAGII
ncbi:MAG: MptD family putative ECF transporter S component [Andreesenia angusta]|nr:MptD family putative ECF transporter S component [Andreesenia angusta]